MGQVIAIANQKGGVGKTTLSMNLAADFARRGFDVLVIDADLQASAVKWSSYAEEGRPFPVAVVSLAAAGAKLAGEVERHRAKYDVIFVDCPPHKGVQQTLAAMSCADLVLMPLRPSFLDLEPTVETVATLEQAKALNPEVEARAVLNCVRAGTGSTGKIISALADLDVAVLNTRVALAEEFGQAVEKGEAVAFRRATPARQQISALADEILEIIKLPVAKEAA